jgi:tetratricopeptide (TPR) repeat protein
MKLEEKLAQAITAAQAGHKTEARQLLVEIVQADDKQAEAWWWLNEVVDSLEDKVVCLENVLTLNPANESAQAKLAEVRAQQDMLFSPVYAPGQEEPPPQVVSPIEPLQFSTAPSPDRDEFDNPWLCPYCAASTQPTDRVCPACHHALVIRQRVKVERTVWLWRGIFLEIALALALTVVGASYFVIITKLDNIANPFSFAPFYWGQPVSQSSAQIEVMLTFAPLWAFWGVMGFVLYSLIVALLLYIRFPNGHIIYLTNASLMLMLAVLGAIMLYQSVPALFACVLVLLIGAVQLLIATSLWNDFTFEETRLRLTFDRGVKGHTSFFISGRKYSELGMWGRAVIHLRRAISIEGSQPTYHIALTVAYINLKRYKLAQQALAKAEKLAPNLPEIHRLKQELATRMQPPSA